VGRGATSTARQVATENDVPFQLRGDLDDAEQAERLLQRARGLGKLTGDLLWGELIEQLRECHTIVRSIRPWAVELAVMHSIRDLHREHFDRLERIMVARQETHSGQSSFGGTK